MIDAFRKRWGTSNWFRLAVVMVITFILLGILMQTVFGLNPLTAGETVLGSQNNEEQLKANETVIHSANFSSELNSIAFTSNSPVYYYLIEEIVNDTVSEDYLLNNSIETGSTEEFSTWIEDSTPISLVLSNPTDQDLKYRFEFRSFQTEDRTKIVLYSVGGIMYTGAIVTIIIYLILGEFLPWLLNRGSSNQQHDHN